MLTIDTLKEFGADTDKGLERCIGNENLYLTLVKTVPDQEGFAKLKEAIDAKDLKAGFEQAHALKGVLSNLSLNPIFKPVNEITELLRARTETDYTALVNEIMTQKDRLAAICVD